jgi:cytochrome c-type biogenesis protein CcmE
VEIFTHLMVFFAMQREAEMAQTATAGPRPVFRPGGGRAKFLVGGLLILGAIAYLIASATKSAAQFFYTVDELKAQGANAVGKNLRVSGVVLGDSIQYDAQTLDLRFTIAQVTDDTKQIEAAGGLAAALEAAAADPSSARLQVTYNGVLPDLMRPNAQAIITGHLDEGGTFQADELLLKCPTRYEEGVPNQVEHVTSS